MHREEPIFADGGRPRELEDGQDSPSALAEAREVYDRLLVLLPEERRQVVASSEPSGDRS